MARAAPAGTAGLVVTDLQTGYAPGFQLSGVTFAAAPGDIVGLIGPNGAGKSTLLKALAGVLPRSGEATLDEEPLAARAGTVAYVPQREEVNWDFPVTAADVVVMGRYRRIGWLHWPGRGDRAVAERALADVGLEGLGGRHISEFSGGQQQRIFLARALAQEPALVLLDEPFTGLDTVSREVVYGLLAGLAARGVVVLMATHDLDEVRQHCSHLLCLNRRLIAAGPLAATFTPENLRATFGGQLAVFA